MGDFQLSLCVLVTLARHLPPPVRFLMVEHLSLCQWLLEARETWFWLSFGSLGFNFMGWGTKRRKPAVPPGFDAVIALKNIIITITALARHAENCEIVTHTHRERD